jgi:hypothetical protein
LLTSFALSLGRKSCRQLATRSCTLATDFLAFLRELLASFLRANFGCLRLRFCWCFTKYYWGFSNLEILVPSATIAKYFNPKSIPRIFPEVEISGFSPSISNKIAAKYLPEGFWLTVTVLIFPSIGLCNFALITPSLGNLSSESETTWTFWGYWIDCLCFFDLNLGNWTLLSKKFL